jgi:hypothetical protein
MRRKEERSGSVSQHVAKVHLWEERLELPKTLKWFKITSSETKKPLGQII